ncbi:MAG: YoaK family protein [Bacteroidota bacterium]
MLRQAKEDRTLKENLLLASSTAFVSGVTNVAGVVAFLAFTSNITGHVANLAKHVVEQNFKEIIVFFVWLMLFMAGAFISNFIIKSLQDSSRYRAHAVPMILEIVILFAVAVYGYHFYDDSMLEREAIIGAILFAMGLQNSLVSNISGGLIKTSHLTGLFTDLGSDLADWLHPRTEASEVVKNKIIIRLTILSFYFIGGVAGGYFFDLYDFRIFYFIPLVLLTILYYDLSPLALHRFMRMFHIAK